MIFRLSQELNEQINAGPLIEMPVDEDPYADWSCQSFSADRTQYIIISNTKSLYSCVMNGKGISDESRLIDNAVSAIREFMEDDGQSFTFQRLILPATATVSFAKPLSRSVTGSMNELIELAKVFLSEGDSSPHEVGFQLNDVPLSSLGRGKSDSHGKPREAFKHLTDR